MKMAPGIVLRPVAGLVTGCAGSNCAPPAHFDLVLGAPSPNPTTTPYMR